MKMKTFTKLFLVVAVLCSQLVGFAVNANGYISNVSRQGMALLYKSSATNWKQVTERQHGLHLAVAPADSRNCSSLFASAISAAFYASEPAKAPNNVYGTLTLASYAGGPDQKVMPSISAYPNPSRGITRLSLSQIGSGKDTYKIKISNTIGKVVALKELSALDVELDMTNLPAGVYFYSLLVNDKMVETKRLILQK